MLPKSYKEAINLGKTQYFPGEPCKHGHITVKFVQSRECAECSRLRCERRRKSPDTVEKLREYSQNYNEQNKDVLNQYRRNKLNQEPLYKKREKERQQDWYQKNKWYFRQKWSRNNALRRNAKATTVNKYLTDLFCSECPNYLTIDHIIPVSKNGIHDISNLQYLSSSDNSKKKDGDNITVNGIYCLPCSPIL